MAGTTFGCELMRVFVVIFEQLVPISGGGTPRIRSVIDILVKRGHEVSVAASFDTDINNACKILNCDRVFPLTNVSRLDKNKMIKYLIFHPLNIFKVLDATVRTKPDIVIAHNSIAGFASLLAKEFTGCLAIVDMTDMLFEYISSYSKHRSWIRYLQKIGGNVENRVICQADKIITVSNAMKEKLIQKRAKRKNMNVVYDGVTPVLFRLDKVSAIALRQKYAAGTENIVMFHGVIDPQDRPEILAEAAVSVLKRNPKTMFWVVGDGVAVPAIKEKIRKRGVEKHFFFSGWIPYQEVPKFISACDVGLVILPSTASGEIRVTLKAFEYWACEKPIVAAELPALKEIVTHGRTGLFYKPEDPTDLAEKICILLDDRRLSREMGKAGRQLVEKRYNWSKLATQFVVICEDLYAYPHAHVHARKN